MRVGGVSNTNLYRILDAVRANPELANMKKDTLSEAFHSRFLAARTTLQVTLKNGSEWEWELADPNLLLPNIVSECPALQDVFGRAANLHAPTRESPWSLVIGFDEFSPGNKLRVDNQRKSMVLSFSFLNLGQAALQHDCVWTTPVVVRHKILMLARGGWSEMIRMYINLHLIGPHGISTIGVPVRLNGQPLVIYARMTDLFSDGDGLRSALDWKGAKALKPCYYHWNIIRKASDIEGPEYVDICCADASMFRRWKPEELESAIDMLSEAQKRVDEGTMTATRLQQLEKATGFNANRFGLVADVRLRRWVRVVAAAMYDWMHCSLQDGTLTTEVYLFSQACHTVGIHNRDLKEYLRAEWEFPRGTGCKGKLLYRVFDDYRSHSSESAERLKASASELLGLYGILRHWAAVEFEGRPELDAERKSLNAACRVVDLFLRAKRGLATPSAAAGELLHALNEHMVLFLAAYGRGAVKPKHHWLFDAALQLQARNIVIDAFVIERIHLRVKRQAEVVKNLPAYERSVLSGCINEQCREGANPLIDGVVGCTTAVLQRASVGRQLLVGNVHIACGDVVYRAGGAREAGLVQTCAQEDGDLFLIVKTMAFVEQVSPYGHRWRLTSTLLLWSATMVEQVVAS